MMSMGRFAMKRKRSTSSESETSERGKINEEIIPKVVSYMQKLKKGKVNIRDLQREFKMISTAELWAILLRNKNNFIVQNGQKYWEDLHGDEIIQLKTSLRLCAKHCSKHQTCHGDCGELHLCRTFLLMGSNRCFFHKSNSIPDCTFGHDFKTEHNLKLLNAHNLQMLSDSDLQLLFRRRVSRSSSTMPQICNFYNGKSRTGCTKKKCPALHLCQNLIMGTCSGQKHCEKNHSLSDIQVRHVLDSFAIDNSWQDEVVLRELKSKLQTRRNEFTPQSDLCEDISSDSDSDSEGESSKDSEGTSKRAAMDGCCSHCHGLRDTLQTITKRLQKLEDKFVGNQDK